MPSVEFAIDAIYQEVKMTVKIHAVDEYIPLIKSSIARYQQVVANIKQQAIHTWDSSVQPLEEAAEAIDRVWNELEHVNATNNTEHVRRVYTHLLPEITDFHTDVMQDEDLYKIFLQLRQSAEFSDLAIAQQTIIKNQIRDFELSGINLAPQQREIYKKLVQRVSELENDFSNNILDATNTWRHHVPEEQKDLLSGLPEQIVIQAKLKAQQEQKTGWLLTLDSPTYLAVVSYADDRSLRKTFYTAYSSRAPQNEKLIIEIMQIRQKIANLTGYNNYSEYSLVTKMANDVAQVDNFLQDIAHKTKPKAEQEFKTLCEFAGQNLEAWDVAYYSEKLKLDRYSFSEEQLRQYFPEQLVLGGMFALVQELYGMSISHVPGVYNKFQVTDSNNKLRGYFYIDLYARDGKRGGAWMADCLSRIKFADGSLQEPVAYLNCNFLPPVDGECGHLTHDDVITLFHEFGHTLHHILTQVDHYSVSGINGVEWDAVELPSQFMENWCWEWSVIEQISTLPLSEFKKIVAARNFNAALALIRQVEFALFDLRLHANTDPALSARDILNLVRKEFSVINVPEFNRFENSFSHIFAGGYAAGYYSYLWAEVLSADAFDKFIGDSVSKTKAGRSFLINILEQGGSKPAMDLFVAFAGREPKVDALLRHRGIL